MGVETKKMANSIATASENFGDRIKSWPERIKSFYNDVRTETRKVTAPFVERSAGHYSGSRDHRIHFWRVLFHHR
jgi:hypothetical protein